MVGNLSKDAAGLQQNAASYQGGPGRSLMWGANPSDLLQMNQSQYVQKFALPPEWGARNEVTVMHFPQGGVAWDGQAAAQPAYGPLFEGGGHQYLHSSISSDYAVWTGRPPWDKVPSPGLVGQGMAKMGGAATGVQLPAAAGQ